MRIILQLSLCVFLMSAFIAAADDKTAGPSESDSEHSQAHSEFRSLKIDLCKRKRPEGPTCWIRGRDLEGNQLTINFDARSFIVLTGSRGIPDKEASELRLDKLLKSLGLANYGASVSAAGRRGFRSCSIELSSYDQASKEFMSEHGVFPDQRECE